MTHPHTGRPVVVGIDGSDAAINAALWATDEAVVRSVPLRLVAALSPAHPEHSRATAGPAVEHADTALRAATEAVAATGWRVEIETAKICSAPTDLLVNESRSAAIVCVGSVGIDRIAAKVLGSTAEAVANRARCPVAVIRSHAGTPGDTDRSSVRSGWVVLALNELSDGGELAEFAFGEAALRGAGVIAVVAPSQPEKPGGTSLADQTIEKWSARYPDVPVQSWMAARSLDEFIASSEVPIQSVVIGPRNIREIPRLVGPVGGLAHFSQAECSVIVIRN